MAESFDVPPTISALLSARIERLRSDERAVVERAAVIGKQFYRGAVAELLAPPERAGIDGHLAALRRKEMVEPEGVYWIDEPVYRRAGRDQHLRQGRLSRGLQDEQLGGKGRRSGARVDDASA